MLTTVKARAVLRVACVAWFALSAPGCVGMQTNDTRDFERFPPAAIEGDLKFLLDVRVYADAVGVAADNRLRAGLPEDVRNAYVFHLKQTGRVAGANGAPAFRAHVRVFDQGGDRGTVAAAVFSWLTLFVIPSWSTHHYTTTVELTDGAGDPVASKTYKHQLRLIQQLFMVFGMPFATLQQSYDSMWNEVMRDAAVWTVEALDETH